MLALCTRRCARIPSARSFASRPNQAIVDLLERYKDEENQSATRNAYRVRAFASAIKAVNQLDHPIRSAAEARALKGVGAGITSRIQAFLAGAEYDPADARDEMRRKAAKELERVHGIGAKTARELVDEGCTHIADLHQPKYAGMLTPAMQIGLKYYSHLIEPVTREEVETVTAFIRESISSKFEVHIGGSYRRGSPTCSDMDLIFLHASHVQVPTPALNLPSNKIRITQAFRSTNSTVAQRAASLLVTDVVRPLEERGLLAATLSCGPRKWQGVVRIPEKDEDKGSRLSCIRAGRGVYRRADFNFVPMKSRGAGFLALTGDVEFNRHIRTRAVKLGMHLNEYGLWRWQEKGYWELVRAESEGEILGELGMEYVEPEKRNFGFVL